MQWSHLPLCVFLSVSWVVAAEPAVTAAPAAKASFVLTDLTTGRPWLPKQPDAIAPRMEQQMVDFTKTFGFPEILPLSKGVMQQELDGVAKQMANLGLHRDASGKVVADKVILWNGEWGLPKDAPPGALDFKETIMPLMRTLNGLYRNSTPNTPASDAVADHIRLVLEYFATRDWNATRSESLWVGNGYALRDLAPVRQFVGTSHLLADPAMRAQVAENAWWMLDGSIALERSPAWSTDALLNTVPQAFGGVAALPNGPQKYQRILALRRALDSSVIGNDYNLVTPDGGVIHHAGVHDHYAQYSFVPLANLYARLEGAGIPSKDSAEINRRLKLAARLWAWSTLGPRVAPNMSQRVYLPAADTKPSVFSGRADFAMAAAKFEQAAGGPSLETNRELAGLVLAVQPDAAPAPLRAAWQQAGFNAQPLAGNAGLPSDGVVIHRRPGWMVVLRGQNKVLRGGEGHGGHYRYAQWGMPNTYGGRFCQGSLFVADSGTPLNPTDSGWVEEGFDYCRVPGTTGTVETTAAMVGSYFGTDATLGGGCSLDGQGIWIYNGGGQRKSCFMVDDRITFVTSGMGPATKKPVTTTIFQNAEAVPLPLMIDGQPAPVTCDQWLAGGAAHTLLDGRARGYYIHPGGDSLRLTRGNQQWTYCTAKYFNPQADADIGMVDAGNRTAVYRKSVGEMKPNQINSHKAQFEGPEKLKYFHPSEHRYSTLGFVHDANTAPHQVHAFTLLMKTDASRLAGFASAMKSNKPPVKVTTSERAHTFADAATGVRGLCLFEGGDLPARQVLGSVTSVSRPCALMEKRSQNQLALAVESTDIADKSPFVIRITGEWNLATPADGVSTSVTAGVTTVIVPFVDMRARDLLLTASR